MKISVSVRMARLRSQCTALISKEAVDDLKIKTGDKVEAVIKATEVMIAKEK